jgi:hypothetical protein
MPVVTLPAAPDDAIEASAHSSGGGRPNPLGSLGRELVGVLQPAQTVAAVGTAVVVLGGLSFGLPVVGQAVVDRIGLDATIWLLGAVCVAAFAVGTAGFCLLPPLLLSGVDRAALVTHAWIGAREARRLVDSPTALRRLPTSPEKARAWLARTPRTERLRPLTIDALILVGRFDEARAEAALLPDRGPLDRYRRREAVATIDDQQGRPVDIDGLQQAVTDIPHRLDRTEALASLAVLLARRAVNGGDWRAPLADVRQQIPGSDVEILVRDFGLPQLQILTRWIVVPFAGLLGLIALSLTVGAGTARP